MIRIVLTAALILLAGCAAPVERPAAPQPEPPRARAALASVRVANLTTQPIVVLYRLAAVDASEVGIGQVPAGGSVELAPVPAGEPIVLIARTQAGAEFVLPALTMAMDQEWTWVIPRDARFVAPAAEPRG